MLSELAWGSDLLKLQPRQHLLNASVEDIDRLYLYNPAFCTLLRPKQRGNRDRSRPLHPGQIGQASRAVQTRVADVLKRKRVMVTGGAGFIGSHVVDLLVEAGCNEVIVVDNMISGRLENLARSMQSGKVRLVVGDIRDEALMEDLVVGVDTVFHHAALESAHCTAEPRLALEVMANATFNLLDLCVRSSVRKIIMASSAPICGTFDAFPMKALNDRYADRTLFCAVKSFGEALLRSFNEMYGIDYVALRYFDVYGPRMCARGNRAVHLLHWIERIETGLPPIVIGDGNQTMDMLHVGDAARANLLAAVSPASDVALNVASGEEISSLTLIRMLARIMGRTGIEPAFWEERPFQIAHRRFPDVEAARQTISFDAQISLGEGLTGLVNWWREELVARRLH